MKKIQKKKILLSVLAVVGLVVVGLISGAIPFTYGTVKCGHFPVKSSNFAASYSYELPNNKEYWSPDPLSSYEFCTSAEAEAEGYHKSISFD